MKKISLFLFVLLLGLPLFSQDKRHQFELAYEVADYTYKEPRGDSPVKLTGRKFGLSGAYRRQSILSPYVNEQDPSFATVELRFMTGNVDYDGSLNDAAHTPFAASNLTDYYFEAALKTGWGFELTPSVTLQPYLGLGWRYLRNHLEEAGPAGYLRTSNYVYMPLGTYLKYQASKTVSLTLNTEFDWLLSGKQYTGAYGGITNTQDQGYGLRAGFKACLEGESIGVFLEPFWRYWHIQNSDVTWGLYEPFNTTQEWGLRAGVIF